MSTEKSKTPSEPDDDKEQVPAPQGSPQAARAADPREDGNPDEGFEIDIDELLERDRRRQARLTPAERELKERVLALVRAKPERFAGAGKRIEAKACRYIHLDAPETLLGECGAMGVSSCLGGYCEQDIDAMPRIERIQFAEELVLIHWIATDADAAEVRPSPTVIAAVPWNETYSSGRMFLRDQIFAPHVDDHDNSIDLVPSPFRERWGQLVQDALEVLGARSRLAPNVERADPGLRKLESAAEIQVATVSDRLVNVSSIAAGCGAVTAEIRGPSLVKLFLVVARRSSGGMDAESVSWREIERAHLEGKQTGNAMRVLETRRRYADRVKGALEERGLGHLWLVDAGNGVTWRGPKLLS